MARLSGLDDIDWTAVTGAHGPVPDLPAWVRALDASVEVRDATTAGDLFEAVFHQGSVYEATAPAIPFLAEISATSPTAGPALRFELLYLIGSAACQGELTAVDDEPPHPHAAAARDAAADALHLLLPILDRDEPALHAGVAFVAAAVGSTDPRIVAAVEALLERPGTPPLRACLNLLHRRLTGTPVTDDDIDRLADAAPDAMEELEDELEDIGDDVSPDRMALLAIDALIEPEIWSLLRPPGVVTER